ncbi:helix-turn-helix domain-containing protein [Leptospira perdikensis]|uniref:Helix-turn-helix domain-containing protein n=1 Tax=Leptospira perdikensis TaxID=2484948 RepID=A0A4V6QLT1_9LEPT|nr:helix-turn-helix domain-containing protein [Leptospira perdikensis]TGL33425.1 helix-turn-helix domain-containing protein [Leptospira perdikensis]
MKTNRTGIWIPVWIEDLNLSHSQTKLYAEIVSLHDKGGCFASNRYFGEVLGLKMDTISRLITSLKKLGLLEQTGFDGRRRFLKPLFSKPTLKELAPKESVLEKNPMRKEKEGKNLQVPTIQKSNAGLEKDVPSFISTLEVQKILHKKTSWDEFKIWSERTLSKSTHYQILNLPSPDFLAGSLHLIWKNWIETQTISNQRMVSCNHSFRN